MVIARACSISVVKLVLAGLFDINENTIRQRLREFYLDSKDKKGQKRTQINVRDCFVLILQGNEQGQWNKHWMEMLHLLSPAIPADCTVIVTTDRGLYSPTQFRFITKMKWHPFMRINKGGTFRPKGHKDFRPISCFANQPKMHWQVIGTAFKSKPLDCTFDCILGRRSG